ncbi:MAG: hypothetical protein ACXABG_02850 [Promethearchaeota archaeon]
MLKIVQIDMDKKVKDALAGIYGLSAQDIKDIEDCKGTEVQIEKCVREILERTVVSNKQDAAWLFLYHFVIVG